MIRHRLTRRIPANSVRQLRAEGKEEAVLDERNLILDEGVEGFEMGMIRDQ
jgi:hypothetical protein